MNVIKTYLDSIFARLPQTPQLQKAKTDFLADMEDRGQIQRSDKPGKK